MQLLEYVNISSKVQAKLFFPESLNYSIFIHPTFKNSVKKAISSIFLCKNNSCTFLCKKNKPIYLRPSNTFFRPLPGDLSREKSLSHCVRPPKGVWYASNFTRKSRRKPTKIVENSASKVYYYYYNEL